MEAEKESRAEQPPGEGVQVEPVDEGDAPGAVEGHDGQGEVVHQGLEDGRIRPGTVRSENGGTRLGTAEPLFQFRDARACGDEVLLEAGRGGRRG
ncbi:hypothetical protein DSECCO2_526820 [anaerobic digester metagenome]